MTPPDPHDLPPVPTPHHVRYLAGAHSQGLHDDRSDTDTFTVYLDPADLIRHTPLLPPHTHGDGSDHQTYSLSRHLDLLIEGRPDAVALTALQDPQTSGTPAANAARALLADIRPALLTREYAYGCLRHFMSAMNVVDRHPHERPTGLGKRASLDDKYLMHALRIAYMAHEALEGRVTLEHTPERTATLRRWKRGGATYAEMNATLQSTRQTLLPGGYPDMKRVSAHLPGNADLKRAINRACLTHLPPLLRTLPH